LEAGIVLGIAMSAEDKQKPTKPDKIRSLKKSEKHTPRVPNGSL